MKRAAILDLHGGLPTATLTDPYNSTNLTLGRLMYASSGATEMDRWVGPLSVALGRPMEQSTAIASSFPCVIPWSDEVNWIFLADVSSSGATRRVSLWQHNIKTNTLFWVGFVTLTPPTASAHTVRAQRAVYAKYTTGLVSVLGTTVTGTGTAWVTSGLCVGSRIGFGSTNPSEITNWYPITSLTDSSASITGAPGTLTGVPYVIEDLRIVMATTNATSTNGGVYLAKGLRYEDFSPLGTTIPAATTTDGIKAVYWLKDAATITLLVANGMGMRGFSSWNEEYMFVGTGTTTQQLYKYNIRAPLTGLSGGATTSAYVLKTAVSPTLVGAASQTNNGRIVTTQHGAGSGLACYYFTTASRIYRTIPVDLIDDANATFVSGGEAITPVWPLGNTTFTEASPGALSTLEYSSVLDRFVLVNLSSAVTNMRSLLTRYNQSPMDRVFLVDPSTNPQSSASSLIPPTPGAYRSAGSTAIWVEGGMAYQTLGGTTAGSSALYAYPLGADADFESVANGYIITPKVALPDSNKLVKVVPSGFTYQGDFVHGLPTEPYKIYFRTAGIEDNSGSWTEVPPTGVLSGIGAGLQVIQFKLTFKVVGTFCIPARLHSITVVYEDNTTLDNYQFSATQSSAATKRFAWRHAIAFGTTVPTLFVRLYDAITGSLLVEDDTNSPSGTFERSTDGGTTWVAYSNADKANDQTYIRYTPSSIADDVLVRAVITI